MLLLVSCFLPKRIRILLLFLFVFQFRPNIFGFFVNVLYKKCKSTRLSMYGSSQFYITNISCVLSVFSDIPRSGSILETYFIEKLLYFDYCFVLLLTYSTDCLTSIQCFHKYTAHNRCLSKTKGKWTSEHRGMGESLSSILLEGKLPW